jgi:hypothetical protein
MAYASAEARQELLERIAEAIDEIGYALAALGAAYEQMDEYSAERLEDELFGPVQKAYGRAKRTYAGFAERHELVRREFEAQASGLPSTGAKGFVESAVDAVGAADGALADVQDSPETLEVGDAELRAGLIEVRGLFSPLRGQARELLRGFGR